MDSVFATSSSEMSIPSAISSTVGSRPSSCRSEAESLADAVQRARPVQRNAHDARLLGQRLENRLPDPPDGVQMNLMPLVSSNLWRPESGRGCPR